MTRARREASRSTWSANHRITPLGALELQVDWEGYSAEGPGWEPATNFLCSGEKILENYFACERTDVSQEQGQVMRALLSEAGFSFAQPYNLDQSVLLDLRAPSRLSVPRWGAPPAPILPIARRAACWRNCSIAAMPTSKLDARRDPPSSCRQASAIPTIFAG
jgi:hypothetical protein